MFANSFFDKQNAWMKFEFFIVLSTGSLMFSTFSTAYGFSWISWKKLFSSSATLVISSITFFQFLLILFYYYNFLTVFQNFRLSETTDLFKLLKSIFFSFLYNLLT